MKGVVLPGDNGGVQYSFFNVDQVYDFLTSIGMKPYVELRYSLVVSAIFASSLGTLITAASCPICLHQATKHGATT